MGGAGLVATGESAARGIELDSRNEWELLRSVVVGIVTGAQVPRTKDRALHAIEYPGQSAEQFAAAPAGEYPRQVLDETAEDLEALCEQLAGLGIAVHRPDVVDFSQPRGNGLWLADGYYSYCPRDTICVLGQRILAAPMVLRHRQQEHRAYRSLFDRDQWLSCPLPQLHDELYDVAPTASCRLRDLEPAFDAANILRFGDDLLYLVSNTGNRPGARLLQELAGDAYRVHVVADVYQDRHIDTTFMPLREGLLLCNPSRVRPARIPEFLRDWDLLWSPEMVRLPALEDWCPASEWIGMNVLSLSPTLVAVEEHQIPLMKALKRHGLDSLPVRLRHCRTLGGGPHCITVDLVRRASGNGPG